jgi:hypothetical protein
LGFRDWGREDGRVEWVVYEVWETVDMLKKKGKEMEVTPGELWYHIMKTM